MGPVPPSRVRDIERNLTTPNMARIRDRLLGGASSLEPDKEEAGRLLGSPRHPRCRVVGPRQAKSRQGVYKVTLWLDFSALACA